MAHEAEAHLWSPRARPAWTVDVVTPDEPPASGELLDALDDAALAHRCAGGSREAFDVIVQRHRRAVYQVCYRFAGNHEDASDLAQDAFVRAWRGVRSFRGQSAFSTWLYRIAVNVCLNRVAKKPVRFDSIDRMQSLADASADHPAAALVRRERAAAVRSAIALLPKRQRATLILRTYHDLPHAQIAEILGSSVGAVKANLFHALANLRKVLGREP